MNPILVYFIIIGLCAFFIAYIISIYNMLVRLKNNINKAWSNISVLLVQRHDEIPKLVDTCKQYMKYEQETLTKVIEARQQVEVAREQGDVNQVGRADGVLRGALNGLVALAENYPELKANASFQQLQGRISQLESHIADRREIYNDCVNVSNIRIHQFPIMIVAFVFHFKERELLHFSEESQMDVNINALFK